MDQEIWHDVLDDRYHMRVRRLSARQAILTVTDGDKDLILRETVSLSYGARFGPDVADVESWRERGSEFIDVYREKQIPKIDDLPSVVQKSDEANRRRYMELWQKAKQRLQLTDTDRLNTTDAQEAVNRAFKFLSPSPSDPAFHGHLNEMLQIAGLVLGDFQVHVFRDANCCSYTIFWHRRNRWISGSNFLFNLGCAIDQEFEKPFVFNPAEDHADPNSVEAKMRDATVGLNRVECSGDL